jgi:DNA-binding transcriptional LysR family regulator
VRHDLTSLKIFVTVAECGNLTRAAEREHLAVSAISKRIGEMEELVGTPLLLRKARGVELTPAGQSLLHHARQMLQLVHRMDEELSEYAGGIKGHVRIHAVASALAQFLPEDLEAFLSRYPQVQISLEERTGKAVAAALADGTAEVGVVAEHTPLPGMASYPYHSDRLVLGVPLGHPLARRKSAAFADALAYPFVGPHAESSLAALMAHGAKAAGRPLQQRIAVSSFEVMCRLVMRRLGITLMPESVLVPHAEAGRLRVVSLRDDWAVRHLVVAVRDPAQLGPIARTLVEHLQRSAGHQPA